MIINRIIKLARKTGLLLLLIYAPISLAEKQSIHVYKSAHCGCCGKWIDHLNVNGFKANYTNQESMLSIKDKLGVPENARSCHTGFVEVNGKGYFLEGHIPAEIIKKFIKNPPKGAVGLTVPGMPIGSPGMEVGTQKDYYEVLLVLKNGDQQIFAKVNQ